MKIGELLSEYRQKEGLYQKEVADLLGISREHYAKIESGKFVPSFKLLKTFSKKLGISIEVVLSHGECTFQYTVKKDEKTKK